MTMVIERRHDASEFRLPAWKVVIDFDAGTIACSLITARVFRHVQILVTSACDDRWSYIRDWQGRLHQLSRDVPGQRASFSPSFSHPPYRIAVGDETRYLYPEGIIAFFTDASCRTPLRLIIRNLNALKYAQRPGRRGDGAPLERTMLSTISLLDAHGQGALVGILRRFLSDYRTGTGGAAQLAKNALWLLGSDGPLEGLVLQRDDGPLATEHERLDGLRRLLMAQAQDIER